MKSILQVLPELESGGVERGVVDIAVFGKKRGYNIIVASDGGRLVNNLKKEGIDHIKLNLKSKNPLIIIANIFRLKKIIEKSNVAIVHARSRAPAWSAYYACKLTGATFITTFHGFYKRNSYFKHIYNSIMVKGEVVIGVSNFIKKHIIKHYDLKGKKVEVIHRGVNLKEFDINKITDEEQKTFRGDNGLKKDDKVILLPGRISRWKGQDIAIKAMAEFKENKNIKLLIGGGWKGNENYYNELTKLCETEKLQGQVIFAGHISNMPLAIRSSDIVLNTSIEPETFGRVSAEAGAMGKPAISTEHGGSIEILKDKNCGDLVPPANPKALANSIREMLLKISDPEQNEIIEKNAINNTKNSFSLELMCTKVFKIYERFLNPES